MILVLLFIAGQQLPENSVISNNLFRSLYEQEFRQTRLGSLFQGRLQGCSQSSSWGHSHLCLISFEAGFIFQFTPWLVGCQDSIPRGLLD